MSTTIWPFLTEESSGFLPWLRKRIAARATRALDWQESFAYRPVRTADGRFASGPLYRRAKTDGSYEYRAMTEAETADYVSRDAW